MKSKNGLQNLSDEFDDKVALRLVEKEDDRVVDGVNILARAAGQFFVADGRSNNNRFYTKTLWEKAIDDTRSLIESGQMLGTIGHDQPIDDQALLDGKVSHRVSKLWIDEDQKLPDGGHPGMGEILVLNTKAGQQLNAYLRGGVSFPVSSRAFGKFVGKGPDGKTPKIDENTYKLEGFDFVRVQGIPGAIPALVESDENPDKEDLNMPGENKPEVTAQVLESLTKEKVKLEESLTAALDDNENVKGKLAVSESRLEETRTSLDEYKKLGSASDVSAKLAELAQLKSKVEGLEKSNEALTAYTEIGTVEEIQEKLATAQNLEEALKDLGSTDEIKEALVGALETLQPYKELGTVDQITEAFDKMEGFQDQIKALGTVNEIKKVMEAMDQYTGLGTIQQITTVFDIVESYVGLGSPEEITEAFNLSEKMIERMEESQQSARVKAFAEQHKISESLAGDILSKLGADAGASFFSKVTEELGGSVSERFKKPVKGEKLNEGDPAKKESVLNESRASRLADKFSH